MTAEERAKVLLTGWRNRTLQTEEMIAEIAQTIQVAIEAERAACAVIVGSYASKIDALNIPDEAKEFARLLREGFILANEEIRARGANG